MSDSLNRDLERLGLERKPAPTMTLQEYLAQKAAECAGASAPSADPAA